MDDLINSVESMKVTDFYDNMPLLINALRIIHWDDTALELEYILAEKNNGASEANLQPLQNAFWERFNANVRDFLNMEPL